MASAVALNDFGVGISVDPNGDVIIGEWCRVRRLHDGNVTTIAGNGRCFFIGEGRPARDAGMFIEGVAVAANDDIFVADAGTCSVRKISKGIIETIAGNGSLTPQFFCDYGGVPGTATAAAIGSPLALAVSKKGDVYVAVQERAEWFRHEPLNCHVLRIHQKKIESVAGTDGRCGFGGDNGPATRATLDGVYGIALDAEENVYLAEYANCRVREISAGRITTIAGSGAGSPPHSCPFQADGVATQTSLRYPTGVAVDGSGIVYIAELGACRVRKLQNGVLTTIAGAGGNSFSFDEDCAYLGDDGPALQEKLNGPLSLAVAATGELLIGDYYDYRVRELKDGQIATVAGVGYEGGSEEDGVPARTAQLYGPFGIDLDSSGNLLIADGYSLRAANGVVPARCRPDAHQNEGRGCPQPRVSAH